MIVYVNPMQSQSPNPRRLTDMEFKCSIWKGTTTTLVQLIEVGHDVEDTMAPPYAKLLKEIVDVFQTLPSGLPRWRKMAHTIHFKPDQKPFF